MGINLNQCNQVSRTEITDNRVDNGIPSDFAIDMTLYFKPGKSIHILKDNNEADQQYFENVGLVLNTVINQTSDSFIQYDYIFARYYCGYIQEIEVDRIIQKINPMLNAGGMILLELDCEIQNDRNGSVIMNVDDVKDKLSKYDYVVHYSKEIDYVRGNHLARKIYYAGTRSVKVKNKK